MAIFSYHFFLGQFVPKRTPQEDQVFTLDFTDLGKGKIKNEELKNNLKAQNLKSDKM